MTAEIGWGSVQQILYMPHTDAEYDRLVEVLDQLIDQVGEDENHPLASLMEVIGVLIERYEDEHVAEIIDLYIFPPHVQLFFLSLRVR
jgi:HTH-type transcriptional regulator/antitoxin HigA